jgi:hypothetical protein
MQNLTRSFIAAISLSGSVCFGATGHAATTTGDISVTLGHASGTHIFLDKGTGNTVTGHVGSQNGDPGTPIISFFSPVAVDAKNGFSSIDSTGGGNGVFHSLTVSVPTGFAFKSLVFDTLKADDIFITGFFNGTTVGTYLNDDLKNGLNEFTALALNGSLFTSLVLFSEDGFSQIKQFEISGLTPVPLPGALVLFGSALVGVGILGRRRKKPLGVM